MTLAEISSSTVFERSSVSGPWSLHVWFFAVPSEDLHEMIARGGVTHAVVFGSTAPGTSGRPGTGVFLQGGTMLFVVGFLLMSEKFTACIASKVVEVTPVRLRLRDKPIRPRRYRGHFHVARVAKNSFLFSTVLIGQRLPHATCTRHIIMCVQ